jgi:hypothetical protein
MALFMWVAEMTLANGVDFEAIARGIIIKMNAQSFHDAHEIDSTLLELIIAALKHSYERGVAETEKRLLLSRVETPSNDAILELAKIVARAGDSGDAFVDGCYWYRDNLKLVPMNLPSDEEINEFVFNKYGIENFMLPKPMQESVGVEVIRWFRSHIHAALGEKKDGET